jgi:hypothetical protein
MPLRGIIEDKKNIYVGALTKISDLQDSETIKNYAQALGRSMDPRPYTKALLLCQEADRLMKSSTVREELLLSQIIDVLAPAR